MRFSRPRLLYWLAGFPALLAVFSGLVYIYYRHAITASPDNKYFGLAFGLTVLMYILPMFFAAIECFLCGEYALFSHSKSTLLSVLNIITASLSGAILLALLIAVIFDYMTDLGGWSNVYIVMWSLAAVNFVLRIAQWIINAVTSKNWHNG